MKHFRLPARVPATGCRTSAAPEPPASLFEMPPGYTVDASAASHDSWMSFTSSENPRGLPHPQDR